MFDLMISVSQLVLPVFIFATMANIGMLITLVNMVGIALLIGVAKVLKGDNVQIEVL